MSTATTDPFEILKRFGVMRFLETSPEDPKPWHGALLCSPRSKNGLLEELRSARQLRARYDDAWYRDDEVSLVARVMWPGYQLSIAVDHPEHGASEVHVFQVDDYAYGDLKQAIAELEPFCADDWTPKGQGETP